MTKKNSTGKRQFRIETTLNNVLPPQLKHESYERFGAFSKNGVFKTPLDTIVREGQKVSEQDELMPRIIGIDRSDPAYSKTVLDYWYNYTITITPDGKDYEYTIDANGNFVGDTVESIEGYIAVKHLMEHPDVAYKKEDVENPELFRAILKDLNVFLKEEREVKLQRSKADLEYSKLIGNLGTDKGLEIARLVALKHNIFDAEYMDNDDLEIALYGAKNLDPVGFVESCNDKNLHQLVIINKGLTTGAITEEGGIYYAIEERVGDKLQLIAWLKDAKNGIQVKKLTDNINGRMKDLLTTQQ